jgi:transposase
VFKDVLCKSGRALICKYESGEALVKAGVENVRRVLAKASQGRTAYRAADVVRALGDSKALRSGQNARRRSILHLIARLNLVESQQQQVRADMQSLLSELSESALLMSVKGMGVVTCAMVLGECGNLGDYRLNQLEKLVGLNLCEFSSGTRKGRRKISKCGRSGVRYALCVAATRMASKYGIYHDIAQEMRSRGMSFGQIRVAVARKLLRLLHALAVQHKDFDERQFVARRKTVDDLLAHQDRSPLVAA